MKFLSVVIPCYNAADTIAKTLDCLIEEIGNLCSYEIIVVNDGSSDSSARIVETFTIYNVNVVLFNVDNRGVSSARNFGLEKATGEYVWFFDADDLCFHGAIKEIVNLLMVRKPDICNFCSVTVDNHTKRKIESFNNVNGYKILFDGRLADGISDKNIPFSCWSSIVRRTLLLGREIAFLPQLCISEDVAWNIDIARKLPDAHYIFTDMRVVKYMYHSGSAVNNQDCEKAKKQLHSYMEFAKHLITMKENCPPYLAFALNAQQENVTKKMYTRLLSSKTETRESRKYIKDIQALTNVERSGAVILLMNKYPSLVPMMQYLYRGLFLRFIKPLMARN